MIKRLKIIPLIIMQLSVLAGLLFVPIQAAAQTPKDAACQGVALTGGDCGSPTASDDKVNDTVATVINIFSFIVGFAAVIMIIIGGFRYVTSAGDSNSVNAAKNTILYAVIGLIIVALAQVIVRFVLTRI